MSTTVNGDCCVSLMQGTLVRPVARYPASIATDPSLKVAANRVQTTLRGNIGTGDTIITVGDASRLVPEMLLTAGTEIMSISSIAGNNLTVVRGFDGTQPACHSSGTTLRVEVDAWHHNALAAEITAIEQALGVNLGNVGGGGTGGGCAIISTNYDFPAQSPGGSLVVGANSITLTPVPVGVNGSDTDHYVYISGGTGTPEPARIIGGSALSGSPSGSLIIQCANTHSGAWTIKSATAGIQEAIHLLRTSPAGTGRVCIPAGTHTIYATITVMVHGLMLAGEGRRGTFLSTGMTSMPLIKVTDSIDQVTIQDMQCTGPSAGANFCIDAVGVGNFIIERFTIAGFGQGISVTGSVQGITGRDVYIVGNTGDGIYINTPVSGGNWDHVSVWAGAATTGTGFHVVACVGLVMIDTYTNGQQYGMRIEPGNGQVIGVIQMFNAYFDGYTGNAAYGILMNPAAGASINTVTSFGGAATGCTLHGLYFTGSGSIEEVTFTNMTITANNQGGINAASPTLALSNLSFIDCWVANNSIPENLHPGAYLQSVTNLIIRGGVYGGAVGHNWQTYGIVLAGGNTNARISGATLTPNITGPVLTGGVNAGVVIKDCIGYNPVGQSTITASASPFTYTAGTSPETVYIYGGTVSNVSRGGTQVAAQSPATVHLEPNQSVTITYSAAPTMAKDVQ